MSKNNDYSLVKLKEKMLEGLEEEKMMKKEVKEEVVKLLEEAHIRKDEIEIVKELKLQYSKQFFVRFPRDLENLLGLKEGKKIKFIIKVNPKDSNEKIDIKLKVVE